ncbi:MAG: VOC family protein [Candidatus Micrarchaeota archaeon]|nr:VOC family protein [Candidatus Micrarchaeota archaeon]
MPGSRISHVVINVSSVGRSRGFYAILARSLGLRRIRNSKDSIAYANGFFSLWVSEPMKRKRRQWGYGYDHIAFSASSRRQVDELEKRLRRAGYTIHWQAKEHPEYAKGYYSMTFRDPDGVLMELLYLPRTKGSFG